MSGAFLNHEETIVFYDNGKVMRVNAECDVLDQTMRIPISKKGTVVEILVRPDTTIGVSAWMNFILTTPTTVSKGDTLVVYLNTAR